MGYSPWCCKKPEMTERLTLFFSKSHHTKCQVIAHCSFDLHFSHVCDIKYLSIYVLDISMSSLETCLFIR